MLGNCRWVSLSMARCSLASLVVGSQCTNFDNHDQVAHSQTRAFQLPIRWLGTWYPEHRSALKIPGLVARAPWTFQQRPGAFVSISPTIRAMTADLTSEEVMISLTKSSVTGRIETSTASTSANLDRGRATAGRPRQGVQARPMVSSQYNRRTRILPEHWRSLGMHPQGRQYCSALVLFGEELYNSGRAARPVSVGRHVPFRFASSTWDQDRLVEPSDSVLASPAFRRGTKVFGSSLDVPRIEDFHERLVNLFPVHAGGRHPERHTTLAVLGRDYRRIKGVRRSSRCYDLAAKL